MKQKKMERKTTAKAHLLTACAGLTCSLALAAQAHAGGFGLREGAADWLGTAFSGGEAKGYDASTVWSNPAGMALLDKNEIDGNISMIAPNAQFSGSNTNPLTGGNVKGSEGGNAIAPAATGATFGVMVLNPDFRLGFSVTSPYAERVAYPLDFVGRYQSLVSSITDINIGLALSYKVNEHLSIGGGPNIDYLQARLTQALNVPGLSAGTGQDPLADVKGNNIGVGYNLGALYQIDDATRIGLDYRSRIRHDITGGQYISIPGIYNSISPAIVGLLNASNSQATTSITLPDSIGIGVYHQITPRWAVMGSLQWTHWALFQSLNITPTNGSTNTVIHENWRNTWFAGVGTNYQVTDKFMVQSGFSYDESPVTNANRSTRVPDGDHYNLAVGAQYQLMPHARIEFAYMHLFSPGGSINSTANTSALTPSGTISGNYYASDNSVTAGLNVTF